MWIVESCEMKKVTENMVLGKTGQKTKSEMVRDSRLCILEKGRAGEGFFVADSRCDHEIVMGATRNGMGYR